MLITYFKEFQRYFWMYRLTLYLYQTANDWQKCNPLYWPSLFAMFLFISLESIWSCNNLISILRHYCIVSYKNNLSKMRISGKVSMFLSVFVKLINNTLGEYIFVRKYFQGTYFWKFGLKNCKFHGRYYVNTRALMNTSQKFNLTEDIIMI